MGERGEGKGPRKRGEGVLSQRKRTKWGITGKKKESIEYDDRGRVGRMKEMAPYKDEKPAKNRRVIVMGHGPKSSLKKREGLKRVTRGKGAGGGRMEKNWVKYYCR